MKSSGGECDAALCNTLDEIQQGQARSQYCDGKMRVAEWLHDAL